MAELVRVVDDPAVSIKDVTEGSVSTDASPMRLDFVAAVNKALAACPYPVCSIFLLMSSGASDSMWFRKSRRGELRRWLSIFIKESENFSHGLNERTPIANIAPAIDYYLSLVPDLSK